MFTSLEKTIPAAAGKREIASSTVEPQSPQDQGRQPAYVLITAAYNEEATIEATIRSVLSQTILPARWVIVSDGSVDKTDEIINKYAKQFGFIRFLRMTRDPGRSFGSQVIALRAGRELLKDVTYDFIGTLDADITLGRSYFEDLISILGKRPKLGLAGGFIYEEMNGTFQSRPANRVYSVANAGQLFRRESYDAIGGYSIFEYGGADWHAQISVEMKGWEVEAFPDLKIFHHRRTGEGDNLLRHKYRQGKMDYCFGSDPFFEVLKCLRRVSEKPFFTGAIARLLGFSWSYVCRDTRPVSDEFIAFLRRDQRQKMLSMGSGSGKQSRRRAIS
jgi:glycosyltransferase involved in cell wall biosynthesis